MAITFVGAASAASTSVSLPTFNAGDVALVLAQNATSTTAVTFPSGWLGYPTGITGVSSHNVIGYRVLQASDTTTGTWTNATSVGVIIYRGVDHNSPVDSTAWVAPSSGYVLVLTESGGSWSISLGVPVSGSTFQVILGLAATGAISALTSTGWTTRTSGVSYTGFLGADGGSAGFGGNVAVTEFLRASITLREAGSTVFPIVSDVDTTSGTVTSNSTSWTLTYPLNIAAGDLLIAIVSADGAGSSNLPSGDGWNIASWIAAGTGANYLSIHRNKASSALSGTFTATIGASEQGSWLIYRISAGTWYGGDITTGVSTDGAASTTGSPSANPDPPSLNPTSWDVENTLWIAAMGADTSRTVSAYPSGFTATGSITSGGSGGATLGYGRLEIPAAPYPANNSPSGAARPFGMDGTAGAISRAQRFVVSASSILAVAVSLRKVGNPTDNYVVEIQEDNSGTSYPNGTVVGTVVQAAGSGLSTSFTEIRTGVSIATTPGVNYWVVVRRSGSTSNTDYFEIEEGTHYTGVLSAWFGSVWQTSSIYNHWIKIESQRASLDPGTFTISASDDWAAATIAIRPAAEARVPRSSPYPQLLAH